MNLSELSILFQCHTSVIVVSFSFFSSWWFPKLVLGLIHLMSIIGNHLLPHLRSAESENQQYLSQKCVTDLEIFTAKFAKIFFHLTCGRKFFIFILIGNNTESFHGVLPALFCIKMNIYIRF